MDGHLCRCVPVVGPRYGHGHGRVVVFQADEMVFPELPREKEKSVLAGVFFDYLTLVFISISSSSASSLGHSLCAIMPMFDFRREVHVDARHLRREYCGARTISYRQQLFIKSMGDVPYDVI